MRREGTDPNDVHMSDVLCDYCHASWTEDVPVIEGHQGSIICSKCLSVAYMEVLGDGSPIDGGRCTMCLEDREGPCWQSPAYPEAIICRRCIKLAAAAFKRDKQVDWVPPGTS
ncbi:MAG: hypothetical protein CMJ32_11500 [Phycisphaerae bacterium]|nr:hypothetical protein [Phycisphaerae bacterium]